MFAWNDKAVVLADNAQAMNTKGESCRHGEVLARVCMEKFIAVLFLVVGFASLTTVTLAILR